MSPLLRRWSGPIIIAAAGLGMMAATWKTWPDPITDFGKEVYLAWQLSQGKRLYVDVAYHLGPLSPYVNALAFKLFGPTLATLMAVNAVVIFAIAVLLYRLIERVAGALAATVAGVMFVTIFAFIHFTQIADYNYMSPYDHAHTHGLLLGLVGLTLADCHRRTGKAWSLFGAGMALGLAFLTRAEFFIAAGAGVGVVVAMKPGGLDRWSWRKAGLLAAGVILPILLAFFMLGAILPARAAFRGVLGSWPILLDRSVTGNRFYEDSMGTLHVGDSLWRMGIWSVWWCVLVAPAIAVGRMGLGGRFWAVAALAWGAAGAAVMGRWQDPTGAFAPLPVGLIACWFLIRKRGGAGVGLSAGMIVWALALLAKIILNARIYHYGFVLAMPATLFVVAFAIGLGSPPVRAAVLGALGVTVGPYLGIGFHLIGTEVYPVGEGKNLFWADERGRMLNDCLLNVRRYGAGGQTLAVMPEGAMLNFLSGMENPTPYWSYNPPFSFFAPGEGEEAGERKIAESLKTHPPDWVVFVAVDLSDFGTPFFGKDYGKSLHDFVERGYTVVWTEGDRPFSGGGFGVMLFRRDRYNGP